MKNFARLFFLSALAGSSAMAQSTSPMKTKALSFDINGLSLSGLNGGMGGKLWVQGNRALIASMDAGYSSETRKDKDTITLNEESTNRTLQLTVGIEQHYDWAPGLSPYLTGGGLVAYNMYESKGGNVLSGPSRYARWTITPGIYGGFGLEYWLAPRVSIAGQQIFSMTYGFGKYTDNYSSNSIRQDVTTFAFNVGTSSLILSVYL